MSLSSEEDDKMIRELRDALESRTFDSLEEALKHKGPWQVELPTHPPISGVFEKMDKHIREENQYCIPIRNYEHLDISLIPPTRSLEEMAEAIVVAKQLDLEKATALEDRIEDELEKQYATSEIVEISLTEAVPDDILEWLRERYSAWNIVAYDNFLEFRPK